ncbi:hypothetical protein [Stenotrophomonas indicatrix]|uniref:hypothetical protein n=1 Tax=Stenotrophomonas indicatrix TaxID=2045451 RepID=UPI000B82626B|nr:hypothetical protein [Stenotrophomonas indicatrix]
MSFLHRFLLSWLGSSLPLVLFVLASQPSSVISLKVIILALQGALGCGLLSALVIAVLIRERAVAMLLAAQVLTTVLVGWYWKM